MTTKILALTKPNQVHPEFPEEDSFKYLRQASRVVAVVADGITRDPKEGTLIAILIN